MPLTPLGTTDIHLWFVDTASLGDAVATHLNRLLSDDEQARAARFVHAADRRDYTIAHALLRLALSRYSPTDPSAWRFEIEPLGKPKLAPEHAQSSLVFNISHTRGYVACAIARAGDVGVDIESVNEQIEVREIARLNFSPVEVAQLGRCTDRDIHHRFVEFWTLKEALVKATGKGITAGLDQWGFHFADDGHLQLEAVGVTTDTWSFSLYEPAQHTRMAVATNIPTPTIVARAFNLAGQVPNGEQRVLPPTRTSVRG